MKTEQSAESIQKIIARLVATSPAGHNLLLIGGFRYRLLDRSVRTSRDIDYHWAGNLAEKQGELLALFRKRLLPSVRRQVGYEGRADSATGPEAESPAVRTIDLSFWKPKTAYSRIEIPVDITRVAQSDQIEIRTVEGVIYPTVSDTDLIENKIIAVFKRCILQHRDLVDLFLFSGKLAPTSPERLARKFKTVGVAQAGALKIIADLQAHAAYHTRALQAILDSQFDRAAADNINSAGGAQLILEKTIEILKIHAPADPKA
jgi:hypothetical protein